MTESSSFNYRKFSEKTHRVIFFYNDYFLQNEIITLLKECGHDVFVLQINSDSTKWAESILTTIARVRPDYIFSTNFIGLDVFGIILSKIMSLQIPFVCWFLDDFRFIITEKNYINSEYITLFTYDKAHVTLLKQYGFNNAYFLPTATNYIQPPTSTTSNLSNNISFVGGTFLKTGDRWYNKDFEELYNEVSFDTPFGWSSIFEKTDHLRNKFSSKYEYFQFASYLAAKFSFTYRENILSHVKPELLNVYGDNAWGKSKLTCCIMPSTKTADESTAIFQNSKIILNASSKQHNLSVNMRLFDVPYCGGFLLTDYNPIIEELFDIDNDVVVYRSIEEMNDKIDYYMQHDSKRETISLNALKTIEKKHKLIHRIRTISFLLTKIYRNM